MVWLRRLLLWLFLLATSPLALACDACIVEQAWIEDDSGQLSLAQVRTQPEHRFEGGISKGFGSSTLWIRLRIDPRPAQVAPRETLYLTIRPAFLDEVTLHDPQQVGIAPPVIGDHFALAADDHSPFLTLRLPAGDSPRDVWLALRSTSTRTAFFQINTAAEMLRLDRAWLSLAAALLGFLVCVLLLGMVKLAIERTLLTFCFVCVQVGAVLYTASSMGLPRAWLGHHVPHTWLDTVVTYSGQFYVFAGYAFNLALFSELKKPRWMVGVLGLLKVVFPVNLTLALLGHTSLAQLSNTIMSILGIVLFALASFRTQPMASEIEVAKAPLNPRVIRLYFWVCLMIVPVSSFMFMGVYSPPALLVIYWSLLYAVFASLMMFGVVQMRSHGMRMFTQSVQTAQELAQQRAEQEREHREDRDRLLAMLNHELKTPLAAIRMLTGLREMPARIGAEIGELVKTVSELVDRSAQSSTIDDRKVRVRRADFSFAALIEHVCEQSGQGARIQLTCPKAEVLLHSDAALVEVIVKNLLENALKYSPEDSQVQVRLDLTEADGPLSLEVGNQPGLAGAPDPAQIFTKYYRSPGAHFTSGTGLGLYVARGLAEALGGNLSLVPDPVGVRFRLSLPYALPKDMAQTLV